MKRLRLVCLAVIMSLCLCGCVKQVKNPDETTKVTDIQNEQIKYLGKYSMVDMPIDIQDEELKEVFESMKTQRDIEAEKLKEDGLSCEDLGIKSGLLCIEIKDNDDVNVCIGGFAAEKAKLERDDNNKYIKLETPYFNGFTDKILLGEKQVDGKNYLTFENGNGKRVYFEQLKNDNIVSKIDIRGYRDFTATGIFEIDPGVTEKQTGKNPYDTWGSGFRTYGSNMKINEDGTGNYNIGVATHENFKLDRSMKSGSTILIMVDEQGLEVEQGGPNFVLDATEIDGENYLILNEGLLVSYWRCVDENQIVFENEDGIIGIWR